MYSRYRVPRGTKNPAYAGSRVLQLGLGEGGGVVVSEVQIGNRQCVGLDEIATWFNRIAH